MHETTHKWKNKTIVEYQKRNKQVENIREFKYFSNIFAHSELWNMKYEHGHIYSGV